MLDSKRAEYGMLIKQQVQNKWRQPSTSNANQSCNVYVKQTMSGDVIDVRVRECSADVNVMFKESVVNAVWAASPLPKPPHPEVFANEIEFLFRPGS
jgi:colicin import membrane protein